MKKVINLILGGVLCLGVNNAEALLEVNLDRIIIEVNRLEQEGSRISGNISVISEQQIKDSNARSVPEVLQQVEGVYVYDNSTTKTSSVDVRGFGDSATRNVLVLIDGRRLNQSDSGAADLVQIPVDAIERIEVIRGGASVLYGDNAVGGVINIITKKGEGEFSGKIGSLYGSYGTRGQHFEVSGEEKGLSYYLYGKYLDKRGYRENTDELYKDINSRLDYQFSDKISASLHVGYHEDNYELPGGLNASELASLGREGSPDEGSTADTKDQYVMLSFDIDPMPDETYLGRIIVDTTYRLRDLTDSATFSGFGTFETARAIVTKGIAAKYIFDQEILGRKVDFVTGVDIYDSDNDITSIRNGTSDITISREDIGAYMNMEFETPINDLFMTGGVRYYRAKYTFDNRNATPSPTYEEQKPDEVVSSGGLKYEYGTGSTLHANWQQTFRYLTTNEWYNSVTGTLNTNLNQQTGEQVEIGIKHNFDNKAVVSVTPYWMETNNEIFFDADPNINFGFGDNNNYDKIRRLGIEFGSRLDLLEFFEELANPFQKLELSTSFTYQDAEFRAGDNDGKAVPWVPTYQGNFGLSAAFKEFFTASLIGHYIGPRFAINDQRNELSKAPGHFVTNLKLAFEKGNIETFITINNLLNEEYNTYESTNAAGTTRDFYPAPEANYLFGVNVKF